MVLPWGARVTVEMNAVELIHGHATLSDDGIVAIDGFVRSHRYAQYDSVIIYWVDMIDWPELSGWYFDAWLTRNEVTTDDAAG